MLKFACLATLLLTQSVPAVAAYNSRYSLQNDQSAVGIFVGIVVVASLVLFPLFMTLRDMSRKPPPSQTPEQARAEAEHYNAQATRLSAKRRAVDAETDLKRSLIESARAESEFQETREIVQHDKVVRALEQQNVRRLK